MADEAEIGGGQAPAAEDSKPVAAFFKGGGSKVKRTGRRNMRKRTRLSSVEDDGDGVDEAQAAVAAASARRAAKLKKGHVFGVLAADKKKPAADGSGPSKIVADLAFKSSGDAMPQQYAGAADSHVDVDGALPSGKKAGNKYTGFGPIRAPTNIRSTSRFDYAPDICKDYKETGFCGYGDSCKFLHDRGDYKHGWQIEKEWQEQQRKKEEALARGETVESDSDDDKYVIDSEEEDLPFACLICRDEFTNPVKTQCGHYFCRSCALKRYNKDSKCAACNAQTYGVFNVARNIIKAQQEKAEKDAAAAAAVSDTDGDEDDEDDAEGGSGEEGKGA